jgi:hypothetical protein
VRDAAITDCSVGARIDPDGVQLGPDIVVSGSTGLAQVELYGQSTLLRAMVRDGFAEGVEVRAAGAGSLIVLSTILGNASDGVYLHAVGGGADDTRIVDSTIVLNGGSGIAVAGGQVTGVEVRNDVLAFNGDWGLDADPGNLDANSPDFSLYFGNGLGSCSGCVLGASDIEGLDPLLTDLFSDPADVCPLEDSPLLEAGTALTLVDRNGWELGAFDGIAPEIGACERP